mgnify:CR=1 FL=1
MTPAGPPPPAGVIVSGGGSQQFRSTSISPRQVFGRGWIVGVTSVIRCFGCERCPAYGPPAGNHADLAAARGGGIFGRFIPLLLLCTRQSWLQPPTGVLTGITNHGALSVICRGLTHSRTAGEPGPSQKLNNLLSSFNGLQKAMQFAHGCLESFALFILCDAQYNDPQET